MAVTAIIAVMPRNREPLSRIHISVDFNADKTAIVNPVEHSFHCLHLFYKIKKRIVNHMVDDFSKFFSIACISLFFCNNDRCGNS